MAIGLGKGKLDPKRKFGFGIVFAMILGGCANKVLEYERATQMQKIDEFDQQVKIGPTLNNSAVTAPSPAVAPVIAEVPPNKAVKKKKTKKESKKELAAEVAKAQEAIALPPQHEPVEVEGNEGFVGRRPIKDPFWVGEKVVHEVTYFTMNAGKMALEVGPYTDVNGHKSYQMNMHIWTSSFFSRIHAVDDEAVNLIDFDTLVPSVFTLHIKETNQLREARAYFDWTKKVATFWERKKMDSEPEQERKLQWDIPEYSQNVFSATYYLRTFPWGENSKHAFRVADEGQNLIFKATVVRKEKLQTAVGEFNAVVIKPEVELSGVAKPVGDIYVWLSDDDRKFILRIESKIKIGTLVSQIVELVPGQNPDLK